MKTIFALFVSGAFLAVAFANEGEMKVDESKNEDFASNITTISHFNFSIVSNTSNDQLISGEDEAAELSVGLSILIGFIVIFTVGGNIMVIMSVVIFRKLRKIPNLLIVSLASADLIMGGIVLPLGMHYVVGSKWLLGNVACNIWTSIDVLSVTASICTLCAISLDRFVAIVMPFEYSTKMTKRRARLIIVFIWILSAAIAFIPINLGWWKTIEDGDVACYEDPECCEFRINKTYAVVSSLISFYIPLIIMIFAYSIVFKIAIKKRNKICNREGVYRRASMPGTKNLLWGRGEYRAVFTMGLIMGTFVICWLPFFIVNVAQVFCDRCIPHTAFTILNWLGYMNSFFNPIIYCHSLEFRRGFKRLLLCSLCREGYQQTTRASLSVSYTPSLSARSSIRSEVSLFNFGFLRKSSASRRASRQSATSYTEKSPRVNGSQQLNDDTSRSPNSSGGMVFKYNNNNRKVSSCDLEPRDSVEVHLLSPLEQESEYYSNNPRSNLITHRNSKANAGVGYFSTHRPIYIRKEKRSMSTFAKPEYEKHVLFKTSSHTDITHKVSDTSFISIETGGDSSRSSISVLDEESSGSVTSQQCNNHSGDETSDE